MAYRDRLDPRVEQLQALIGTEAEVREQRRQLRAEYDQLQAQSEQLAEQQREGEGVLATVRSWLGGESDAHAVAGSRTTYAEATERLTELEQAERALDARLREIEAARGELGELERARGVALRSADSPVGEELRAIDASLEEDDRRLAALEAVLVTCDRAEVVLAELQDVKQKLDNAEARSTLAMNRSLAVLERGAQVADVVLGVVTLGAVGGIGVTPTDRDDRPILIERMRSHLPLVQQRLREFVDAFDTLDIAYPHDAYAQLVALASEAIVEPPGSSAMSRQVTSAIECLDQLITVLGEARGQLVHHRDQLVEQQQSVIARAL
jgi:DNA repair exonuclease SbcCD ATPase subunit